MKSSRPTLAGDAIAERGSDTEVLALAHSEHPIAEAIVEAGRTRRLRRLAAEDFETVPGFCAAATVANPIKVTTPGAIDALPGSA